MSQSDKGVECLCALMVGAGIILFSTLIFFTLTSSTLLDSGRPDSAETTLWARFVNDGLMTWLCAAGTLFGVGVATVEGTWPFLRRDKPAE